MSCYNEYGSTSTEILNEVAAVDGSSVREANKGVTTSFCNPLLTELHIL